MITEELLAALKAHCRIDHSEDDALLMGYYAAAVLYLRNAGVKDSDDELYQLAAFSLVLGWYDGDAADGGASHGTRRLINQLKQASVAEMGEPRF